MHNPASMLVQEETSKMKTEKYDQKDEAEKSAYKLPTGELYIPSIAIFKSIINGASFKKAGKYSAKGVLSGNIRIEPFQVVLLDEKKKTIKNYEIDLQTVVIQRARIVRSRARIDKWRAVFTIIYNERFIGNPKIIRDCLEDAGGRVGLLEYRPQKGGSFGTFDIKSFKVRD